MEICDKLSQVYLNHPSCAMRSRAIIQITYFSYYPKRDKNHYWHRRRLFYGAYISLPEMQWCSPNARNARGLNNIRRININHLRFSNEWRLRCYFGFNLPLVGQRVAFHRKILRDISSSFVACIDANLIASRQYYATARKLHARRSFSFHRLRSSGISTT